LANIAIDETIHTTPQISNPPPSNTNLTTASTYAHPQSKFLNLPLSVIFDFFAKYKGGCNPGVINQELGTIDIWYEGSTQFDVRFGLTNEIMGAWLVTLGQDSADFTTRTIISFLQLGRDTDPMMELVMTWSEETFLPSIFIPQGQIMMRPDMGNKLIRFAKKAGVIPKYWENKAPPSEAGYIPQ
jgi:hypothetical protein